MKNALDEMERRRTKQLAYNKEHGISPKTIVKAVQSLEEFSYKAREASVRNAYPDEAFKVGSKKELAETVKELEKQMKTAAESLDFEMAAILRDRLFEIQRMEVKTKRTPV
jgi:excinuclease ABC subunit B